MDSKEREMTFEEADRRYAEIKKRHEAGGIGAGEFDERLKERMVKDEKGRWWAKSRKTGEWHYDEDGAWRRVAPSVRGGASSVPFAGALSGGLAPVELIVVPYALVFGFFRGRHDTNPGSSDLYFPFQVSLFAPCFLLGLFGRTWYTAANLAVLSVALCLTVWISAVQLYDPAAYFEMQVPMAEYVWLATVGALVALGGVGVNRWLLARTSGR